MSSLMFLTRDGEAAVSGLERRKFAALLQDLAWRAIERDMDPYELAGPSLLRTAVVLPDWTTKHQGQEFGRQVRVLFGGPADEPVNLPGRDNVAGVLEVHCNTVVANHSGPVALAARLGAQAECNAWIDGTDRKWLADLIEHGSTVWYPPEIAAAAPAFAHRPLFNQDPSVNSSYDGWAAVVDMLRNGGDGIVVIASSHADGFPDQFWAGRDGELRADFHTWWRQATPEQRWDRSEAGLRQETEQRCPVLRISPGTLHARLFGRDRTSNPTWCQVAAAWRSTP